MADIILPQVDLLTSTDDNTNVLVEQGGQINRVNKSLFGSSDAETLNGHAASYFAPAASLSTTNTNVSNLTIRVSTIEGDYAKSSNIIDYSEDISGLDARITTLEHTEIPNEITRTLLATLNEDSGNDITLNDNLTNYDYLEITDIWTYDSNEGSRWYGPNVQFVIDLSGTMSDPVEFWITAPEGYRGIYMAGDVPNRIHITSGLDTNWETNNYILVPKKIYGIKYN